MTYLPPALSLQDLHRVHPAWLEHRQEWIDIRDIRSRAVQRKEVMARFLPKAEREWPVDYKARLALTEFVPECFVARNRVIGALFGSAIARDLQDKSELSTWSKSVDGRGHGLDDFGETRIAPIAFDFGAAHVLIDRPSDGGTPPADRAEAKARGIDQPYLCVYTPLELRNWSIGADGSLEWVLIVEETSEPLAPGKPRRPMRTFRYFDRQGWSVWKTTTKDGAPFPPGVWDAAGNPKELASEDAGREQFVGDPIAGEHGASTKGLVPLVSVIPDLIAELIGEPLIGDALRLDLKLLRLDSDLQWDLYNHAHPLISITSSRSLTEVGVGTNTALKLNPDKDAPESAEYLNIPTSAFSARQAEIAATNVAIHRHMGLDPLGVITDGPKEASGVARAYSFSTSEGRHLGRIANRFEDAELSILTLVAAFLGVEPPPAGAVRWPEDFDDRSASDMVEQGIALPNALHSPTALKRHEKRLARRLLGELAPDEQKTIDDEIDAAELGASPQQTIVA